MHSIYPKAKRILDIVEALVGLILLSPLFLIVAIAIKIEEPKGRIFFLQNRNGLKGKEFKMWKFKSMVSNAEQLLDTLYDKNEATGYLFKIREDPRVTRIGRIIRKTNIDELPQLINVLKGEMSLVGPRPPLPREVEHYNEYHMKRLEVKPGITGLWQVSDRKNWSFDQMVELDLKYIRERNIFMDIKIILKTFKIIFSTP